MTDNPDSKILIYTDGGYSRLRNVGGYAFIIQYLVYNKEHELYELKKEHNFSKISEYSWYRLFFCKKT